MSLSYRKARTRTGAGRIQAGPRGPRSGAPGAQRPGNNPVRGIDLAPIEQRSAEGAGGSNLSMGASVDLACIADLTDAARAAGTAPSGARRPTDVIELFPDARTPAIGNRLRSRISASEAGMATAEYAIATLAAVGFAGLLVVILRSDQVRGLLLSIIEQALSL